MASFRLCKIGKPQALPPADVVRDRSTNGERHLDADQSILRLF